jgi:hypothetical protein
MEKLKENFKKERADWDIEKITLQKRAKDAEAALKPVAEELTGLKRQINAMTTAVFGKYPHFKFSTYIIPSVASLLMLVMMQELALPIWALTCRRN